MNFDDQKQINMLVGTLNVYGMRSIFIIGAMRWEPSARRRRTARPCTPERKFCWYTKKLSIWPVAPAYMPVQMRTDAPSRKSASRVGDCQERCAASMGREITSSGYLA